MNKNATKIVLAGIALIGAFFLVRAAVKPKPIDNPFPRESRAHLPFEEFIKRLAAIPDFERKLRSAATGSDPTTLGFEIAQNGLKRLDDATLDRRMELVVKLVEHMDVATCAMLSRNDSTQAKKMSPNILRALEHLSSSDIRAYFDLTAKSVEAELNNATVPGFSKTQAERSMVKLVRKFSPEEQALLMRVTAYPSTASDDSACWIVKSVFSEIMDLPPTDRHAISRMVVMPPEQRR